MDKRSQRKVTLIHKLGYLLSAAQKKQLWILSFLLFIGIAFEMLGLGILIPALALMLNADVAIQYPSLQPVLRFLGNPTQMQLVFWGMSSLVFVYTVKALFLVFLSWRQSRFSAELTADLSRKLFLGYLQQPYSFHLQRNSAELLRNIQSEIIQFSNVSQAAISLAVELSMIIGVAFTLILVEPLGALVVTSFLAVSAYLFHRVTKNKLLNWGQRRQHHSGLINQHLLQGLGGVKDVKLLGREAYFLNEFSGHNDENARIQMRVTTLGLVPRSYLELLAVIGLAGLIILMVAQGNKPLALLLPTVGVFVAAAFRMLPSVNRIMAALQSIRYVQPVIEVLYSEFQLIRAEEKNAAHQSSQISFKDKVDIRHLEFQYPNTSVKALDDVCISIGKGESVGFVGPSGSGKSTLIDLILGLLEPTNGGVFVDDLSIAENLRNWQDQIGYVPQSIYLTDDNLRRNVAFGIPDNEIDSAAVQRAVDAAQLDEFIKDLPEGLETFVGERGIRLSGGQRQRIGIARALYHDPEILVLDEATSALDMATEKGVMEAVNALHGKKTIIIVAHRLSTVENCDRLYKLERGKVVAEGVPGAVLKMYKTG